MSRLVDPTICPDCRANLDATATCTGCGLQVAGPLATQLWSVMVAADRLVEDLRRVSLPAPAGPPIPAMPPIPPMPPVQAPAVPKRRLPAFSVPVVLLSLGALCLLVAAIVFVAVTWSVLGLTGRTVVLLGITGLLAGVAVVLTRRDLRGAAETFWLIVAGMLTVDLLAAESAGLAGLDALSWRGTSALVGGALFAMGAGVALWARYQPVQRLYGVQGVALVGALVAASTNAWAAENVAVGTALAVPVLAAGGVLLRRALPAVGVGLVALSALSWLVLLIDGWTRALEFTGFGDWWSEFRGWPLLVATVLAAAAVPLRGVPDAARSVLAGLALLPLAILVNAPVAPETPTRDLLVGCATLVAVALVARLAPLVWARGAAVLTAVGALGLGLLLMVAPAASLESLPLDGTTPLDRTMTTQADGAAPWTLGVAALALVMALGCLLRFAEGARQQAAARVLGTLAPAVLALGALALVLALQPPLWGGVLAGAVATAVAAGAAWWSRDSLPANVVGSLAAAYFALVTVVAAAAAHLLSALVATAFCAALAVGFALRDRTGRQLSSAILGVLGALTGGYALVEWGLEFEADAMARAFALAAYAGLGGVAAAPATRRTTSRVALEASAIVLALAALAMSPDLRTVAMVLTIVGSAVCLVAVLNRDRELLGWAGAFVLGVATLVRFDIDVRAPELYTLPAAALLIGTGIWRLRTDVESDSFSVLGSGLTLALLPSLLLALDEPVSLRGALVGAAGVLVLAAGVQLRLAAPFVLGAVTTGILAVRHLEPVAEAVPRWITLGMVGVALLAVGITWEARLRNLHTARRYLTALR